MMIDYALPVFFSPEETILIRRTYVGGEAMLNAVHLSQRRQASLDPRGHDGVTTCSRVSRGYIAGQDWSTVNAGRIPSGLTQTNGYELGLGCIITTTALDNSDYESPHGAVSSALVRTEVVRADALRGFRIP
eukprot:1182466-Prorocentrum_minimum.AAC.5